LTLYRQYLQRGPSSNGFDRNDFLLRRAQCSSDPTRLMVSMANYTSGSSFSYCVLHLEGEEVFGSAKWFVNCFLGAKNDFHRPNHVNFSHPQVTFIIVQPNLVKNVGIQQWPCGFSAWSPLVSWGGFELKKIFVLMANGGLNTTHLVLLFNVLCSRKPRGLNVKQRSTFTNL
jgi:hypothetical protein